MRNNKGITMIALIVTIIILLILAGVTIAFLTGENGILNKASTAAETTKKSNAKERLKVELMAIQTEELVDGKEANLASLDTNKEQLSNKGIEIAKSGTPRDVTLDGYTFKVKNDLTIEGDGLSSGGIGGSSSGEQTGGTVTSYTVKFYEDTMPSPYSGGDGSESNPYLIDNAAQLRFLSISVNEGSNTYEGKYLKLNSDITLDSSKQWIPIGNSITNFNGTFDGNCKIISGIYIKNTAEYQGIFGCTGTNSYIKRLICKGNVSGGDRSGGLVGMNYGIIEKCGNFINVSNNAQGAIGGIAGINNGFIKECYNKGTITSNSTGWGTGGIAGYNKHGNGHGIIINCYNTGNISTSCAWAGGIVGHNNFINGGDSTSGYIYNSYSINKTNICYESDPGIVENCYTTDVNTKLTELNAGIDEVGGTNTEQPWIVDTNNINEGYPILLWQTEN